jgi:YHS domain-containing protein
MALLLLTCVLSWLGAVAARAAGPEVNLDKSGLAVHGYDPVAYFTEGKPAVGRAEFSADHDGATYRFATAVNRDTFLADPGKYAPQYGGFCAYGTALGKKFDGDPQVWKIVDGKLYLNLNKDVSKTWHKDIPGYIHKADSNWPHIKDKTAAQLN